MAERRAIFRRILAQGWPYRWLVLLAISLAAASGGLAALLLNAVKHLFDAWSRVESAPHLIEGAIADMHRQAWILAALAPLAAVLAYSAWVAGQHLAARVMRDLRARFVAHLVRLDLDFHAELSRGDLLARMSADLGSLLALQQALYGKMLQFPLQIIAVIGAIFWHAWQLAAVLFLVLLPLAVVVARLLHRTRRRSQRARESLAQNLDAFEQITAGIRVVKTIGSADREVARYADTNQRYYGDTLRVARARAASNAVTEGFIFLFFAVALVGGAWMFRRDLIEPSTLLTVLAALGIIISGLRNTQRSWGDVVEQLPAAERVFAVLDRVPALAVAPNAPAATPPKTAIRLEGIRFRYPRTEADVLRGLDLEIPVGGTVALVGESGGGKSTVLDLIPRLRDITAGRVTWDGVDVRALDPESLIAHCAIVSQEPFLFNATVRDNIRYGRPGATDAEIEQAARRAHVHDAILALEGGHGYATVVGDRGGRLSGGQRQRIAIARALLRDAPVLLLDEPTSALDAASEAHVQAALAELMRGRTVVLVAHRLATVRHADRIHVLSGKSHETPGVLLESGTHDELVARGGAYAALVRQQSLG